ncbi:MAG: hypothetical protein WCI78_12360 [Mycobacterium sp.]
MHDDEPAKPATDGEGGATFSRYGVASAVLGVLSVVAVVIGAVIWSNHHDSTGERDHLTRVMGAAADWTNVLINMNSGNIDTSLQQLHDGTVGQLNSDFGAALAPYRQVVQKLQAKSTGRIEAVAIETVHHDPGPAAPGAQPTEPQQPDVVAAKLPPFATRTDSVLVVATSVSENAGAKPTTVHWNLRLDVCDVEGKLMIAALSSVK